MRILHTALLIFLAVASHVVDGFDVGVRGTSCSLNNDPCKSLYGAQCDGKHCRCPIGTTEDKSLKRCKKSSSSGSTSRGGKGSDDLSDLPFDYVPGKKPEPRTPKPETNPGSPLPTTRPPSTIPRRPNVPPLPPNGKSKGGYDSNVYDRNKPNRYPGTPGYPGKTSYDPNQRIINNPNYPGYNPNQPGYNPNQHGYDPNRPGYNPNRPGYNQPGYNPDYPGSYYPNQPGGYHPGKKGHGKGTYAGDSHIGEKAGGGLGGAIGLVVLGALLYFCCKGDRGQGLKDKLPFFKSSGSVGGGQAGANYPMQQQGFTDPPPPYYPSAPVASSPPVEEGWNKNI